MKKITVLFLLSFLSFSVVNAASRTKEEARSIAEKMAEKIGTVVYGDAVAAKRAPIHKEAVAETDAYYIFDYGQDEGFIVVSGDDRMPEIVGYTDSGAYDAANVPPALAYYLEAYARTVAAVAEGDITASTNVAMALAQSNNGTYTPVKPLVSCKWDQSSPYNLMCPTYNGGQCVTGCSATAAAQIMYYHKYPQYLPNDIAAYTTSSYKISIPAIASSSAPEDWYDWDNMLSVYTSSATEVQQNAVAKLMYHVGAAMKMDYGLSSTGGSGAYTNNAFAAYKTFGYDTSLIQVLYREQYTYSEWMNVVLRELTAKRPINYLGYSSGGGHSFVLDGIDADGLVHINWGWGGLDDGYFDISVLNPDDNSGIGASSTSDGYNGSNGMIVGITPQNTAGESKIGNGSANYDENNLSVSFDSNTNDGKLYYSSKYTLYNQINVTVTNNGSEEYYGSIYLFYQKNDTLYNYCATINLALDAGETKTFPVNMTVSSSSRNPLNCIVACYHLMAQKDFTVEKITTDPVLSASITSNTSSETYNGYPVLKEKNARYTVTFTNSGGYYRGKLAVGYYSPTTGYFSGTLQTLEVPGATEEGDGTSTYEFIDNNITFNDLAGICIWDVNKIFLGKGAYHRIYAEGPTKEFTFGDANYASNDGGYYSTLYLDYAVNIPDGVTAYVATIEDNANIHLSPISGGVIPANTGVVLEAADASAFNFTATNTDTTIGSDLHGVLEDTAVADLTDAPVYVLNIADGKPLFKKFVGSKLAANKAYLIFPSSTTSYSVGKENTGTITSISAAPKIADNDSVYYNLQGQRVTRPAKGIYIQGSKKVLIND